MLKARGCRTMATARRRGTWHDDRDNRGVRAPLERRRRANYRADIGSESPPRARRKRSGSDQFAQKQRKAREGALQVLFEVDLVGHDVEDVRARQFDQMLLADGFREFAERLVDGVLAHRDDLDALIAAIAPAWPVRAVAAGGPQYPPACRSANCSYSTDVPVGAVINEAVELAKRYGSENSGKFINGALGTVAARITAGELTRDNRRRHNRNALTYVCYTGQASARWACPPLMNVCVSGGERGVDFYDL